MSSTRQTTRGVAKNAVHGFTAWILPLALSFIATPIIVRSLGLTDYGIYALIVGFIGYSFTFAVSRAITKYVSEYRAAGEIEKISSIVSATLIVNLLIGGGVVLFILVSAPWMVTEVLQIDAALAPRAVTAVHIAGLIIFFTLVNQVFSSILQGMHRFDVFSRVTNAAGIALALGNVALALLGYGVVELLAWCLATTIVSAVAFAIAAKRLVPELSATFRIGDEAWNSVLRFSSGVVGYQILANAVLLFERGWITRHLGPETLTYYVLPMMLAIYVHGFIASVTLVLFPLASELKSDRVRLEKLYFNATKIVVATVVFLVATLIAVREPFLAAYVGRDFADRSSDILILHLLSFGSNAILIVAWQMNEGFGRPGLNFRIFAICALLAIPLMILLIGPLGSFGVAVARLIGFGTIFFSLFYIERKTFGSINLRFWSRLAASVGIAAALAIAFEVMIVSNVASVWIALLLSVSVGGITYAAALWMTGFIGITEREIIRSILQRKNA